MEEFSKWINEVVNPERIVRGLKPINEAEIILCFGILELFHYQQDNLDTIEKS
jgi:hypothetical protein